MDRWNKGFEPWFLDTTGGCALLDNKTNEEILTTYFRTKVRYINYGWYQKLAAKLAAEVVSVGQDNSLGLSTIQFIYMDVGCWAGDGGKGGWTKHREFGIVCGPMALLCSFGM